MKSYVFDASALIDLLDGRPGAGRVERVLDEARRHTARILMSVVNWGEVFHHLWRVRGPREARLTLELINRLPVELVPADRKLALQSATYKAKYKVPYADCFAAATARQAGARLLTSDPHFRAVAGEVKILWLR